MPNIVVGCATTFRPGAYQAPVELSGGESSLYDEPAGCYRLTAAMRAPIKRKRIQILFGSLFIWAAPDAPQTNTIRASRLCGAIHPSIHSFIRLFVHSFIHSAVLVVVAVAAAAAPTLITSSQQLTYSSCGSHTRAGSLVQHRSQVGAGTAVLNDISSSSSSSLWAGLA